MPDSRDVADHYTSGSLLKKIEEGLRAAGAGRPVPLELLAAVDELHIGGRAATELLLESLGLREGQRVLDVGCGIGGPARFAAHDCKVEVVGLDLTAEFVETGRALTAMAGLSDRVRLVQGSALELPFGAGEFDAAWMIHVGMNIADKHRLVAELARVLAPGARLAIFDVMKVGPGDIDYPVPWAQGPRQSALAAPAVYREAIAAAGLELLSETDRTAFAEAFFARRAAAAAGGEGPPPLGPHLVLGADAGQKMGNVVANLRAGRIAPVQMIARKPG